MEHTINQIIADNADKLSDITQKQTDTLLKKLLFEKLCINEPKLKTKPKKKKKPKYRLRAPPSSSESESESD